ncbi:MAG: tripartite tricarboxylate transporter substrate-binding protein [Aquincola sp.]|nr:tripartite tricarboxylate transporter substrate-binding protein [Aquincola sp.]MDH4290564.1 tripartite tricarboxylate transporter substrate-binding protein [Aquincola sp.]MDH5332214.1 tripartite tricarboxylate transporter substrate-binding protein [Aquincola sp.]
MDRRQWLALAGASMWAGATRAQSAPNLNLVVPVPPGGSVDLTARLLGEHLPRLIKQNVVVDNRPGASGSIAAAAVARQAGDVNTMMLVFDSHVTNPLVYSNLSYTLRDFTPISRLLSFPLVFAVPASLPADNIAEFVALAKKRPGALNVSSAGLGTLNHLAAELFKARTNTHIVHIPYRGGVPALQAVMNDEVQLFMGSWVAIGPHVKAGRVKVLGVTSAKRSAVAPELPTLQEAGVKDFDVSTWIGLLAPARIGVERQQVLHAAAIQALSQPAVRATLAQQGLEWVGSTPAEFEAFMAVEARRWKDLVNAQNISFG